MCPLPNLSPARRAFKAAIISGSDIFSLGVRSVLRNDAGADAACVFTSPEQLALVRAAGMDNIDLVIIDDDVLTGRRVSLRWINALDGLVNSGILVLAGSYSLEKVKCRLSGGARACVDKRMSHEVLMQAISAVLEGRYWVEEGYRHLFSASGDLLDDGGVAAGSGLLRMLTPAEQQVVRRLLTGMTVSEIALETCRSVKTVSGQKQSAMRKLHVDSLIALARVFERPFLL